MSRAPARRRGRARPARTAAPGPAAAAVGVDTGGTFTDFVALRAGRLVTAKRLSAPRRPEAPVLAGLAALGARRGTRVRHGSTVATNTLLERTGARVALVTTAGFEDVLEIGRQDRPSLYALAPRRLAPLAPAARRIGVRERTGPRGEILTPLTDAEARRAARAVRRRGAETVAIGLLHGYASDRHERALERALAPLGVPVTRASALCPEIREHERLSTAVANAYLAPRMGRYLDALARGTPAAIEVVLSHGGLAPPARAAREPARQLLSGPAAGLLAAWHAARAAGFERALTVDVGGTSTDCAYVEGELPRRRAREIAGVPVLLPVLDVVTVGAGGGSIARAEGGGRMLAVGPGSAGADPGPACYGRGGPATVTDALVALGRLPLEALAGGAIAIDRAAAERALAALARALGLAGAAAAAEGVVRAAEARMAAALRRVSIERGHDPHGAALVAFGGAGGLHACALAAALGAPAIVFPAHAGVLSALGALAGGARRERSRSVLLDAGDAAGLERAFRALERAVLAEFPARERPLVRLERHAEARYRGQSHELSVRAERAIAARVHAAHARAHGFADRGRAVEVVTVEVRGVGPDRWREVERAARAGAARPPARERAAVVRVRHDGRQLAAAVIARERLAPGARVRGPAIVVEAGATLWIAPGWSGRVHRGGSLVLARGRAR